MGLKFELAWAVLLWLVACASLLPFIERLGWLPTSTGPPACEFQLEWDDRTNFVENEYIRSWEHVQWMFVNGSVLGVYEPLGMLTKTLEYNAFGLDLAMFVKVSVGLHVLNAWLLARTARRTVHWWWWGWQHPSATVFAGTAPPTAVNRGGVDVGCALGAAVWAVHPLRVELIGWASCQPYLLATAFLLLSVGCFVESQRISRQHAMFAHGMFSPSWFHRLRWHYASLACFGAALLCKAAALPLPGVLMMLVLLKPAPPPPPLPQAAGAHQSQGCGGGSANEAAVDSELVGVGTELVFCSEPASLRRSFQALWATLEFWGLAVGCGVAAVRSNDDVSPPFEKVTALPYHTLRACYAIAWHVVANLRPWPVEAAPIYPVPENLPDDLFEWRFVLPTAVVLSTTLAVAVTLLTLLVGVARHRDLPSWLGMGCAVWCAYVCSVAPTLTPFSHGFPTLVTDRYSYIPSAIVVPFVVGSVVCSGCWCWRWASLAVWGEGRTGGGPTSGGAGVDHPPGGGGKSEGDGRSGEDEGEERDGEGGISTELLLRGVALTIFGLLGGAWILVLAASASSQMSVWCTRDALWASLNKAMAPYPTYMGYQRAQSDAFAGYGTQLARAGDMPGAAEALEAAVRQYPANDRAQFMLAGVFAARATESPIERDRAVAAYQRALELAPHNARAHFNLGTLLQFQGQWTSAAEAFEQSAKLHVQRHGESHEEARHATALAEQCATEAVRTDAGALGDAGGVNGVLTSLSV